MIRIDSSLGLWRPSIQLEQRQEILKLSVNISAYLRWRFHLKLPDYRLILIIDWHPTWRDLSRSAHGLCSTTQWFRVPRTTSDSGPDSSASDAPPCWAVELLPLVLICSDFPSATIISHFYRTLSGKCWRNSEKKIVFWNFKKIALLIFSLKKKKKSEEKMKKIIFFLKISTYFIQFLIFQFVWFLIINF